jgi:dienelactone hydrolase
MFPISPEIGARYQTARIRHNMVSGQHERIRSRLWRARAPLPDRSGRGLGRYLPIKAEAAIHGICYRFEDMAEVVLFHHALGLTPGVVDFADKLRGAGEAVHTPDLYDGRTFETFEDGIHHAEEIGFGEVIDRGVRAVDGLSAELVYAGFSLGVLPAQKLAQTRPGARGALLFYSCIPVSEFSPAWPAGVPVQVHGMDADPIFVGEGDVDAARALVESTDQAELFLYPGDQHYFADSTLPSYDADAAALLLERTLAFLRSVD